MAGNKNGEESEKEEDDDSEQEEENEARDSKIKIESPFITEKFDLIHQADPLKVDSDLKGSSKD